MINKNIYIDLDGTTWNSTKSITQIYNERYNEKIHWWEVEHWNFDELNKVKLPEILSWMEEDEFFERLELMPWFWDAMEYMYSEHYNVNFVSIGTSKNLELKEKYLKKFFKLYPYNFVPVDSRSHTNKQHINWDNGLVVDDKTDNLDNPTASVAICYGRSYNWNDDWFKITSTKVLRAENWIYVIENLRKLEKS